MPDEQKYYWVEDFVKTLFPYEPIIDDHIIALGEKMFIIGPSEAGKSYLALQLAMEMATGGDFFGRSIMRPFRTLVVQAEVSEGEYRDRVEPMLDAYGDLKNSMLAIMTTETAKINTPAGFTQLAKIVVAIQPEIIILDPLRAFFSGDENDSGVGETVFEALAVLQRLTPIRFTAVIVHHVRKPSLDSWGQQSKYDGRGSGVWSDRPRTILGLTCNEAQTEWQLAYLKTGARRRRPGPQKLVVNWETRLFELDNDDTIEERTSILLAKITGGERALSDVRGEMAKEFKVSEREVERWITTAERDGRLERVVDPMHRSRKLIRFKTGE